MATVEEVRDELVKRGFRAEVDRPSPPYYLPNVSSVNVWRERTDRHPVDTIWAPSAQFKQAWTWGPSFEHNAPEDWSAHAVADKVHATVLK